MIIAGRTELSVLRPFRLAPRHCDLPPLTARHGGVLIIALTLSVGVGEAQAGPDTPSILGTIFKWTPLLARGFSLNVAMSFLAMAFGTVMGLALGLGLIAQTRPVRAGAWLVTQFFRNAPWL
ncbi:MAG TPA: amino acid ABC transporter permease, partial [Xanthobacteraceae bacterium]|nr:amino acid ABC transporter permease [Xanthobacteraceae bacterium]